MSQCRDFLDYLSKIEQNNFDKVTEIKIITLNSDERENSSWSCRNWHKFLKCVQIIAIACRLKLASYLGHWALGVAFF